MTPAPVDFPLDLAPTEVHFRNGVAVRVIEYQQGNIATCFRRPDGSFITSHTDGGTRISGRGELRALQDANPQWLPLDDIVGAGASRDKVEVMLKARKYRPVVLVDEKPEESNHYSWIK